MTLKIRGWLKSAKFAKKRSRKGAVYSWTGGSLHGRFSEAAIGTTGRSRSCVSIPWLIAAFTSIQWPTTRACFTKLTVVVGFQVSFVVASTAKPKPASREAGPRGLVPSRHAELCPALGHRLLAQAVCSAEADNCGCAASVCTGPPARRACRRDGAVGQERNDSLTTSMKPPSM